VTSPWAAIEGALRGALAPSGFDLVGATTAGRGGLESPAWGRADRLLLCVGNTRALWPRLKDAVRRSPELRAAEHPLDDYARATIGRAAAEVAASFEARHEVRYAGDPRGRAVDIVRAAEAAGLGHRAPSRLLVHPSHGPWIGLRAAVLFDAEGPSEPPLRAPSPCEACATRPCLDAYRAAVDASGGEHRVTQASLERDYPLWLAIRAVCPVGRASRYDEEQAEYHYTKRRALLSLEPRRGMD
jgi:methylmalonic aciduria homocystinuria type C protein